MRKTMEIGSRAQHAHRDYDGSSTINRMVV